MVILNGPLSDVVMQYNATMKGIPQSCEYIFGVANASLALLFDFFEHFVFPTLDLF